jgi:putative ABC transport system permease protein
MRRNVARSLLIAAVVAVPVAGATMVDGAARSVTDPEREAFHLMASGDGVIAVTDVPELTHFIPLPDRYVGGDEGMPTRDPSDVDIAALLPAGTTLVTAPVLYPVRVDRGDGTTGADILVAELDEPLTANRVRLESGSWPSTSDEVLVNKELADHLGISDGSEVADGATITMSNGGPTATVTGIAIDPATLHGPRVFAAPDSTLADHLTAAGFNGYNWRLPGSESHDRYIASFPAGTDVDDLWPTLATQGVALIPRQAVLDPERYRDWATASLVDRARYVDADMLASASLVALIIGLGLLEVILLAGTAFAVGAKRQVRDLGLVAAGGGTARHIKRIVLAQGVLLGVVGAGIGLAVGLALTVAGKSVWQRWDGATIDAWHWGPELAIAAAVGVFSGLAAALVPAISAARMSPIDALARRFRTTSMTAQLPKLGVILIVLGAVAGLLASRANAGALSDYAERIAAAEGTGAWVPQPPNVLTYVALQLFGAVVAVVGLIMVISFLVSRLARRMGRWPMSARYATRDAVRHRHRTTPAIAAIMIVVAGASGVSFALAANERVEELRYQPSAPPHTVIVDADHDGSDLSPMNPATLDAIAASLPGGEAIAVEYVARAVVTEADGYTWADTLWLPSLEHCVDNGTGELACYGGGTHVAVASPALVELALGRAPTRDELDHLATGGVLVLDESYTTDGQVSFEFWDYENDQEMDPVTFAAHVADYAGPQYSQVPMAFIDAGTVESHGWTSSSSTTLIPFDQSASTIELDAAFDTADRVGYRSRVENGPPGMGVGFLILAAGAAFVTLIGVGIVVSLAAAEGRADLATMAAVGAPPRRRRAIAGWQALVVAGFGTLLGLALGTYYGYLTYPSIGAPEFIVPWPYLALIGVGVPLLATAVAITFTRSRLPMLRRLE